MSETQQMLSFLDKLDDSMQTIIKYIDNPQGFILTLILPFQKTHTQKKTTKNNFFYELLTSGKSK